MKRAIAAMWLAILLIFSAVVSAQADAVSLLENGSFEMLDANGEPEGWYAAAYRSQAGYSRIAVTDEKAHSGLHSAVVANASSNDARYTCTVRVKPETLYRLSGYVLVDHMEDTGNGANFGIEGLYAFSDCLFDTAGEWQYLEWYGETGEDQTELTFGVRVGGYSAESTGKAYFDDIALEEVDVLPEDIVADLWYDAYTGFSDSGSTVKDGTEKSTAVFVLLGLAFAVGYVLLRPFLYGKDVKKSSLMFGLLTAAALILRVVLAANVAGYEVDINCFTAWSLRMAEKGPAGFYAADYFCDYPPGAMLLLWQVGLVLRAAGLQNAGAALVIVKSLPILCDLLGAFVLYRYACKHGRNVRAMVLAALYLFNPAVLVNGAAWGQMDSVLALFLLLTTLYAIDRNWKISIPLFVISALIKPQALLFAPLGGMWLLADLLITQKRKQKMKQAGIGLAAGLFCGLAIVLPFSVHQPWNWLFELYRATLSSYAYATLNTANLYYLIGANWTGLEQAVPMWLMLAGCVTFGAAALLLFFRKRNVAADTHKLIIAFAAAAVAQLVLCVTGASYAAYGYCVMGFVYLFAILCMFRNQKAGTLPLCMATALVGIYVLGVKVHERYLFPALLLMLVSYLLSDDRRVLLLFVGFSVTTFINTAIVLDNSILFGAENGHLNQDTLVLNHLLCVCNLVLCGFAGWIAATGLRKCSPIAAKKADQELQRPVSYENMLLKPADHRLHLRWQDYVIMGATTLIYAFVSLCNLGSMAAPQTAWVSTSADEAVVLELEENTAFSVLYYAGVSYYDFSIQVSDDGETWSEPYPCQMREGLCYRWNYAVTSTADEDGVSYAGNSRENILWLKGKYLRVNACNAGLNLWEIVARDEQGQNLPLKLVKHLNAHPDLLDESKPAIHLIDETETCVGEPGWFNGTYFDEIYHARTGYEHLHGIAPYETTHPPLGKLMMSAGIAIFGMTPFGWRFAGAFIGVLMLPVLYLLAMQLTHKRTVSVVAMLAFSLDLMHFTQTRIATIDSFPVFFILLSYLFMVRYMQMDAFSVSNINAPAMLDKSFLKTLLPLLFSGMAMGLSIASKWIGIYSAVGLAILFFVTIYRQYRAGLVAWELELADEERARAQRVRISAAQRFTLSRILITCGCCVIFFVLIPCLIYYLSYIPYLSPTGPATLKRLIAAQKGMLQYHSTPGLGMDHPFQSPWWQWPFILKPMWFAQDAFEPAGYASTIMCMGNPWVFYIGAFAMGIVLLSTAAKYLRLHDGRLTIRQGDGNLTLVALTIAFLAQYLPWVLVPRSMYIYHYFASVPFIILATAWLLDQLPKVRSGVRYGIMAVYVIGALVFFVMFFPYASGLLTSTEWLNAMKWFPRIYY